jgi:glyoxylase-like metal-dependent hydrolase (beta-lactamase superfamily II)
MVAHWVNPLFLLLFAPFITQSAVSDEIPVELSRVNDRVLVLTCLSNNVTAIAAGDGMIVVDTHRSPSLMNAMKELIVEEMGRGDFRYVINTHGHWDHSSGNQVFPGAEIVGHTYCADYIRQSPATTRRLKWARERAIRELEENSPDGGTSPELRAQRMILDDLRSSYVATPPNTTFEDRLSIDAGDVTLELYHCGWAHTDHDVLVFVPEEKLLFTGDVICSRNGTCFAVDAVTDVPKLVSILDEILEREQSEITVIRGHGEFFTRDDLLTLREVLRNKSSEVEWDASAARYIADLVEKEGPDAALTAMREMHETDTGGRYMAENEFYVLGRRYMGRGETDLTIGVLEFAIESLPESALLYDTLAEAYVRSNDIEKAVRYYRQSLELEPLNKNAKEMLLLLHPED